MLSCVRTSALAIMAVSLPAAGALAAPAHRTSPAVRQAHLVDQRGHTFTLRDLRGMPAVVTFVAAHCTQACPLVNAQFERAEDRFARAHARVRLLTITLDPEHDSLRDMREVARRFHADPRIWIVAGGSPPDVHAVMAAFGVVAQRGRKGYADVHTTFVYFLDARGRLRKTILASTALGDQIAGEVGAR